MMNTKSMNETINLNNRPYPYKSGATIASLMTENDFDFPSLIVKINGEIINEEDWKTAGISSGDNVEILHIFGGG